MKIEDLKSISQVSKATLLSESAIRRGLKLGRIKGVKLGRDWLLPSDEIHRLSKSIEEVLYPAMESGALDIIIGKGPSARTVQLELPPCRSHLNDKHQ